MAEINAQSTSSCIRQHGHLIATVGAPAAGKTFLAERLVAHFGAELIREHPAEGFPPEIVSALSRQVDLFETIIWFRNHQLENYERALSLVANGRNVVLDTPFYQNQLYIELYVKDVFRRNILYAVGDLDRRLFQPPDCTVYIATTEELAKEFLRRRAGERVWEDGAWPDFITKMPRLVDQYMRTVFRDDPSLITVCRDEYDFAIADDFRRLLAEVNLRLRSEA